MSLDSSYQETIDYLYALQKHGIKLALSNSLRLMEVTGNPHARIRTVHVAGTNGKGSTSALLAGILTAAGFRVGLYTSPHLISFPERIRIDGRQIPEDKVVELAQQIRSGYAGEAEMRPTFFEVTTTIAFAWFAQEQVDIAVIEVGMGGRLDATNVITPLVSVITNIGIEHTEYLGTTLAEIAAEKAGIIKPGIPVVTAEGQPEAAAVIERTAAVKGARVIRLEREFRAENVSSGAEGAFDYRGMSASYQGLRLCMLGRHQVDNACLALAAIECLRDCGMDIGEGALRRGLERTQWEGRMERVWQKPDIYLDGAHNPASAKRLAETIRALLPAYRRLVLVIGILGDKDLRAIAAEIVPLAGLVVATRPEYSRALDVQTLAAELRKLHGSVLSAETVGEAVQTARDRASEDDLILVTGSLYVVGDARALFAGADEAGALMGLKG